MAAYTLAQLLTFFRNDMDDTETPYLWSDSEFYRYMDTAQRQFARDTKYFYDSQTSAVCDVTVTAGQETVTLDPRVFEVRRAQLDSTNRPLSVLNFNELDTHVHSGDSYEQWEITSWSESTGTPRHLVLNVDNNEGRLVPAPTGNTTLSLWVYRDPLTDIDDGNSTIEVADRNDQLVVLLYAMYLAYSKQDADVYDERRANAKLAEYQFGVLQANSRLDKYRTRPGTVRYGGL